MRASRTIVTLALIFILGQTMAFSAAEEMDHPASRCGDCHVSATPTADNKALKDCTRPKNKGIEGHTSAEAPDVFILDQLSEIYVPVVFPHKLHASMTEMGGGCVVCHHRSPEGRIPPCRECHGGASNPVNLRQPGLKGAYHRQCLSCHREWSHSTDCVVCHAKIDPNKPYEPPTDTSDIMGILHPNIEVPDVKVYEVKDLEDTPFVTFHHKDHSERFGLKCVECHHEESCDRCHDTGARTPHVRQDPHEDCDMCHQQKPGQTDCMFCHKKEVMPVFNHETRTGFKLNLIHQKLACSACHKTPGDFTGLNRECTSCHKDDWPPESFDHTRIGVHINELHVDMECSDCHAKGIGKGLSCDDCHDDGRNSFPLPGEEGDKKEEK